MPRPIWVVEPRKKNLLTQIRNQHEDIHTSYRICFL